MRLRLDLHVHTRHSLDCRTRVEEVVARCRALGLDGFAITDHDSIGGISEAIKKKRELVVVPGEEVSARGGHVLALGVRESVPPRLPLKETVDMIHAQGATAIFAHPYYLLKLFVRDSEVAEAGFDAVEVANATHILYDWMLMRNSALARKLGLPQTGGSDAHIPEVVGRAYTVLEAESREVNDVLGAIRNGHTEAQGSGVSLIERLVKKFR